MRRGSKNLRIKGYEIIFDFQVKTANYAISCAHPFVFFLVDFIEKTAYYLPFQDYFIANVDKMTVLKTVAKSQYTFDEERKLQKVR